MIIQVVHYLKHGQIELFSERLSFTSLLDRDEYIMRMAEECSHFVSYSSDFLCGENISSDVLDYLSFKDKNDYLYNKDSIPQPKYSHKD